jgi:hypothetical protein
MLTIWKARQSTSALDSWSSLRRELSVLYSRFYGVLLVGLLIVYQAQWALRYVLFAFFSFWWPQVELYPRRTPIRVVPKVDTNCTAPSLIPTVNGNTVRSFSTHRQQSAAKGSSTTVSRSDIRLIQYFDFSALRLVRRWLLTGYFPILYYPHPRVPCAGFSPLLSRRPGVFVWLQIVRSAVHDLRRPLLPNYVIGSTAARLLVPLYIYGCPTNFLRQAPDPSFCVALTLYVALQVSAAGGRTLQEACVAGRARGCHSSDPSVRGALGGAASGPALLRPALLPARATLPSQVQLLSEDGRGGDNAGAEQRAAGRGKRGRCAWFDAMKPVLSPTHCSPIVSRAVSPAVPASSRRTPRLSRSRQTGFFLFIFYTTSSRVRCGRGRRAGGRGAGGRGKRRRNRLRHLHAGGGHRPRAAAHGDAVQPLLPPRVPAALDGRQDGVSNLPRRSASVVASAAERCRPVSIEFTIEPNASQASVDWGGRHRRYRTARSYASGRMLRRTSRACIVLLADLLELLRPPSHASECKWSCGLFECKGVSISSVSPPGPLSISYGHVGCVNARAFPPPRAPLPAATGACWARSPAPCPSPPAPRRCAAPPAVPPSPPL